MTQKSPGFHGFLVIDKPAGLTSRDVVNRAQGWFPRRTRIGHAGTLDPLATGVLPLAVGAATRLVEYVQRSAKFYEAGIRLGGTSDTDDAEGTITPIAVKDVPERGEVEQALAGFIGEIEQVPPAYSAAKVTGRRAYDLARQGEKFALIPRRVVIGAINLLAYDYPRLRIEVRCGKGTYIRSLARDLGQRLGCGGYIESLRRTRVGPFRIADAIAPDADRATARAKLLPLKAAVESLPFISLREPDLTRLRNGGKLKLDDASLQSLLLGPENELAVFDFLGRLALVAVMDRERQLLRPGKVMPVEG